MDQQILVASATEKGKSIALKKSAADDTYYVQEVKTGPELSAVVLASGILEYEDAKLVYDRHAKRLFNEVGYEITGG